jgi:hypothetical protein
MIKYQTRYNVETRKWEYGYWNGSVFVVQAKYPAVNTDYSQAA